MANRIPRTVVHYSAHDPRNHRGGVESFARNLRLIFEEVVFMTPGTRDEALVRKRGLPVICDNQMVLDWPSDLKVIGFQHGVAWRKAQVTKKLGDLRLALRQARAARRRNVVWAACAAWISRTFGQQHGNAADVVVYHPVDLQRFDGQLDNAGSRLVLHDARTDHKGQKQMAELARALPNYQFEALDCAPDRVAQRMRGALAFVHLSRYEGNSLVCTEAMAMNLPCLFTKVGLMLDTDQRFGVEQVDVSLARAGGAPLIDTAQRFLAAARARAFGPRAWVAAHAGLEQTAASWAAVLHKFDDGNPSTRH
jgi:hypothetical protein